MFKVEHPLIFYDLLKYEAFGMVNVRDKNHQFKILINYRSGMTPEGKCVVNFARINIRKRPRLI